MRIARNCGTWSHVKTKVEVPLLAQTLVVLLFGPGRIGKIASELGRGIKSFREGRAEEKTEEKKSTDLQDQDEPK